LTLRTYIYIFYKIKYQILRFLILYIRSSFLSKYFRKVMWVLNNFLTMECYRKLCNRLYWKKLKPGTLPYTTRFWLILLSAFSVIWLAFFFDPMDPNCSKSPSRLVQLVSKIFQRTEKLIFDTITSFGKSSRNYLAQIPISLIYSDNILLNRTRYTYLKTSSFLI
jgi:hypothetical protein